MNEAIIVAVISGGMSLLGVIVSGLLTGKKQENAMRVAQAVTDTKIEALTCEVREHNQFARRMPVVEEQIKSITGDIRELKRYHAPIN